MVGLGKSIGHAAASLEYADDNEKKAVIVYKNLLMSSEPNDIAKEFRVIQDLNSTCKMNMLSFVISPEITEGKKIGLRQWGTIAKLFLADLGLEDHQSIGYLHRTKKLGKYNETQKQNIHHMHLYVSRIGFDGTAYSDSFIGAKSMKAAERVAKKLGLQTLPELREKRQETTRSVRKHIHNLHLEVCNETEDLNLNSYVIAMKSKGVMVIKSFDKLGNLRGCRIQYNGYDFKASEVHRSMSKNGLNEAFAKANKSKQQYETIRKTGSIAR